jgi:anaerobic dimethyl sulfoxide reductase subunit C (anchor subunit)
VMTKCNLCFEAIDAGLPPACVAACPLRCLELVLVDEANLAKKGLLLWELPGSEHPFPLPARSRTEPHLIIEPHPSSRPLEAGARVSNREEISPEQPRPTARRELPLIFFTLLAQLAVGAFLMVVVILGRLKDPLLAGRITLVPLLAVGVSISLGLLGSFFHLGRPQNAWRMLTHLRKSWLSRELLFSSLFAGLWAVYIWMRFFHPAAQVQQTSIAFFTVLCGLMAVYGMQRVYQLRSVPAWKPGRTLMEFAISTFGLGSLLTAALLPQGTPPEILSRITLIALLALAAAIGMTLLAKKFTANGLNRWRLGLWLLYR